MQIFEQKNGISEYFGGNVKEIGQELGGAVGDRDILSPRSGQLVRNKIYGLRRAMVIERAEREGKGCTSDAADGM